MRGELLWRLQGRFSGGKGGIFLVGGFFILGGSGGREYLPPEKNWFESSPHDRFSFTLKTQSDLYGVLNFN